jgi:Zn-finger nucleic acid-binding protein
LRICPINRNGLVIDQCTNCGGIYLDAGELEGLERIASEFYARQYGAPPPAYPASGGHAPGGHSTYRSHGHGGHYGHGHGGHYGQGQHGHKRRKGFLGELFD